MPEDKKPTQVEVDLKENLKQGPVEVDLESKSKQEEPKQPEPTLTRDDLEKLHKRNEFLNRNLDKALRQIQELVTQRNVEPQQNIPEPSQEEILDDLDQLAQKDWKQAVKVLGRQAAEEHWREIQAQQEEQVKLFKQQNALEKSRNRVLSEFPELAQDSSEISELYREALELEKQDDPDVITNPRGPEVVRDRMKELARERGITLKPERELVDKKVDEELKRRVRTQASSNFGKPTSQSSGKVTLSEEEVELANRLGIPYEQLARVKKQGANNFKEGVTVS